MGKLIGITVIKEKADLYDDWKKMYEEDLERLEKLEKEEEKDDEIDREYLRFLKDFLRKQQ